MRQNHSFTCSKKCSKKWSKIRDKNYFTKRLHEVKTQALEHYSGNPPICACCGENHVEFLTIDHVHGNGKEHRRNDKHRFTGKELYVWLIENNFPLGLQVLCMNCNFLKSNQDKQFCKAHHPELY